MNEQSHAEINGTKLFYLESGRGMPFVALHGGLGFDHAYMRSLLGPLEDLVRVAYLDQRGNGRSDRPPVETITMPQLVADLDAFREHLGYQKIGLAGHSYGSFVALEYALAHPGRVTHLVLVGASPGVFEPTAEELAERRDRSWVTPQVEQALQAMFADLPATDEEFAARLPAIAPAYVATADPAVVVAEGRKSILSASALRRGFEVLAGWSVADRLGEITCPTLIATGRHDLLTTPECAKRLATAIPGAELAYFENSGHMVWLDEPQAFSSRVRDFLVDHW